MFRKDESSSDFVDIELGDISSVTQSTIADWIQESHPQSDLITSDQSRDTEPLLQSETSDEVFVSISTNDSHDTKLLPKLEASDGMFALCPNEVLLAIFSTLPVKDLILLSKTCDRFHTVIKDYILKNRQNELHSYRIGFFKQRQLELNDEIDDLSFAKVRYKTVLGLILLGILLTALVSRMLKSTYDDSRTASRDEKIIVTILFVASIATLLSGIISMLYNIKLNMNIDSAKNHIEKLEDNIRYDYTAQRQSRALKLL